MRRTHAQVLVSIVVISVVLLPTLGLADSAAAQSRPGRGRQDPKRLEFVPGEILVQFKPGTPGQAVAEAHRQHGGQEREVLAEIDVRVLRVPRGQEVARADAYSKNPNVSFAEVNGLWFASDHNAYPNDTRFHDQWAYRNVGQTDGTADADIDAFEAWATTKGSGSVAIAILDSGIREGLAELPQGSKITRSRDFTGSGTTDDRYGHGTHVAGTAAAVANNTNGVAGTCPGCVLYNAKVLDDSGSGAWSAIANGITWAADNRAKVISMSFGGYFNSRTVELAVNRAWNKGVVMAAAALNDGQNWGAYPAAFDKVIAVAATDHDDAKWEWSNHGANWVDVAAPGVDVLSTVMSGGYESWSGTSMATPHVAGVAGLIWSKSGLCGNNSCVRSRIESNADRVPGSGDYWIKGRINACRAVGAAGC